MKYKVGDVVKIVGRNRWQEENWTRFLNLVGKTAVVKEVYNSMVSVTIDGVEWGFDVESVVLIPPVGKQLEFNFMSGD